VNKIHNSTFIYWNTPAHFIIASVLLCTFFSCLSVFFINSCHIKILTIIIANSKNIIDLSTELNTVGENPIIILDASPTKNTNIAILFLRFPKINNIDKHIQIKFVKANINGIAFKRLLLFAAVRVISCEVINSLNDPKYGKTVFVILGVIPNNNIEKNGINATILYNFSL